jgi:pimeloyl-ACP methyl ester carboxylesterase
MRFPFGVRLRHVLDRTLDRALGGGGRRAGDALYGPDRRDALGTLYRPFRVFARDGLALAGRDYGHPDDAVVRDEVTRDGAARDGAAASGASGGAALGGPPLLCLPGLSRNGRDFEPVARHLRARGVRVVTLDFRGRGASEWDDDAANYNPMTEAEDVAGVLDALALPPPLVVGTSRGGIVAMVVASRRVNPFAGVVLNDIGPVVDLDGLLKIKSYIGRAAPPADWPEAVAWVARLTADAFPDLDGAGHLRLARRLFRDVGGRPVADYDPKLAAGLEFLSPLTPMPTLWPQFAALAAVPVMVIRGERSDILSAATVAAMAAAHPGLVTIEVARQGHAPLLEDAPTLTALADFHTLVARRAAAGG